MKIFIASLCLLTPLLGEEAAPAVFEHEEPQELVVYNRILAKVNDKTISVIDVMKKMDLFLQKYYPHLVGSKMAHYQFYSSQWREYLTQMIDQELMLADAEKLEIKVTDAEVREEMLTRFGPNIMPILDDLGLTYDEARTLIQEEMLVQRMIWFRVNSKALSKVKSLDIKEAYKQYCEKNPELEEWDYQVLSIRSPDKEASAMIAARAFELLQSKLEFSTICDQLKTTEEETVSIHRGIQNLANGNVGASDLQQAQTLAKQGLCKHKLDAASCKDEDADEASGQLLRPDVYITLSPEMHADEKSASAQHKEVLKTLSENSFSKPIAQVSRVDNSTVYRIFHVKKYSKKVIPPFGKMAEQLKDQLLQEAAIKENIHYLTKLRERLGYDEKHMTETLPNDFQPFALR